MLGLAGLLLVFAAGELLRTGAFVLGAETALGEVRDYRVADHSIPFTDPEAGRRYYPQIAFTIDGLEHQFSASQGRTGRAYEIGEQVSVVYNPEDVSDARLATFSGVWGRAMVLLLTSGLFALSGGVPYLRTRRARESPGS